MSISTGRSAAPFAVPAADVDDKVGFLSLPESYPDHSGTVSVIQTHHAWIFLTSRHAWKMKKPHRQGGFDFSSLDSRRQLCEKELRLNRRLARHTYLAVVPLTREADGRLRLNGSGPPVEWLVKMRRLPLDCMLPVMAAQQRLAQSDIDRVLGKLCDFYRSAHACRVGDEMYANRLREEIAEVGATLRERQYRLSDDNVERLVRQLGDYVATNAGPLEVRQSDGFVIEAHGDLRPEHICLLPGHEPEIIDCLEFDEQLRCLDRVEELAYFGLECRVLGHAWVEERIISWYDAHADDRVPPSLWNFYAARRGLVRAMLSARHALDAHPPPDWHAVATDYLERAAGDAAQALAG